jgi:hypothetical protein
MEENIPEAHGFSSIALAPASGFTGFHDDPSQKTLIFPLRGWNAE